MRNVRRRKPSVRCAKVLHTVTREGIDLVVEVTATCHPEDPGKTYGPPERCYPREPAELNEVEAVVVEIDEISPTEHEELWLGKEVELTVEEMADIEAELFQEAVEDEDGEYEMACEAAYDQWKEERHL